MFRLFHAAANACLFAMFIACLFFLSACTTKQKLIDVDPAFSQYIEAYTSGVISKKSVIRIRLAEASSVTHTLNETVKENLFHFTPSISGKAYWTDARTIEFKPEKDLGPNKLYEVSFDLDEVMKVPSKFKDFAFNVQTIKPSFEVTDNGLRCNNNDVMTLSGQLLTADVEDSKAVEQLLLAKLNNSDMKITWQHNEQNKTHNFTITDIHKSGSEQPLTLQWNGSAISSEQKDSRQIIIPKTGDFKVLSVRAVDDDEQYALVQFSEPLATSQQLEGLLSISGQDGLSYSISGSEVKMYTGGNLDGNYTVSINEGIENKKGNKLTKEFSANTFFENRLPGVKIYGKGVILPNSGGKVVLPFEAINLNAIDVSVIKIYENNVAQFLQQNDLNGESDLRRVAKPLVQATVRLDDDASLNLRHKNRFSLDLDKYIKTEPGALYRVFIGFKPNYSLYACDSLEKRDEEEREDGYYETSAIDEDDAFWQRYDDYYPYGYDWDERENPCAPSYYNKERFASRNILASNIGLTAKYGNDKNLFVAVSNLITTNPMNGVELQVLDYQNQVIGSSKTDGDGLAQIDVKRKPYLLIAKQGNERGYLKLDDGSSLPLSRFDIDGDEVKNGLKAFIFGERGVWRPGDSLFLSTIIEDKTKNLPADQPVEMDLISPKGQLYKKLVQTNDNSGFNVFRTATDADAPTGNWLCRVKVGGAQFEKQLKIETVMPNRLKIDLNFNGLDALGKDADMSGTLTAKWLFGATAQNLKARVDAQLYKKSTTFPKYKDYVFDNPTSSFTSQSATVFDGTLDSSGKASVSPTFKPGEDAPGQLLANLVVKVFEPGGNFSIDNISMPFNPYSSYVGIKAPEGDKNWGYLPAGKVQDFDIAEVNTKGQAVSGSSQAEVALYKIQWRWWWDNTGDNLSNFTQDEYNKLIRKDTVTLQNGKGVFSYKTKDDEYGRYLVLVTDKNSGHTAGTTFYVSDPYWQTRSDNGDATAASMLSFTADKDKYNVGDKINLTIPSGEGGRALISLETGSKVLKTYWVETTKGQTHYTFEATKGMSPNVYVNVTLVQPHAQTVNDLPVRMYGVLPVLVEDKNTVLKPIISMADNIRPEENSSITVSEASGKSMTYVVAIVDEGLLDLTHFKTPDPHQAFYAKEALSVKSWDLYDYVIGAWGGELERILTIGGDAEAELASKTRRANRFPAVVKFLGPFTTSGGKTTHAFVLPSYMGSVRAMVIAAGDNAFGMAEKAVTVKKPLMMLTTLPRVLAPLEEIKIPVTVFATDASVKNVSLSLQSNPYLDAAGTQTISFPKPGEQVVYFTAKVKPNTGIGKIVINASGGGEKTKVETEIDIRNPNPYQTQTTETVLQPGASWKSSVAMIGDAMSSKATLEISSVPAMNLESRLTYLITYPHGCIEQTTSSVFPQLVLNQLLDLSDKQKADIDRNVRAGIQKIQNFQTSDGGFSYWPDEANADEWGSNYAGHFLLEASANGYNISSSLINGWKSYERGKALSWNVTKAPWYGTDLSQAYRLYLLALAKSPEVGAMNRLKEWKFLTPEGKWRLAAAYYLIGQNNTALQLISGLPTTFAQRKDPGFTYGSALRDEAMVLEALTIMKRRAEAAVLVKSIAAQLSQDSWYSTQTTAYSLVAMAKYTGANNTGQKINAAITASGKNSNITSDHAVSQTTLGWQNGKATISLANKGNNVLYVRVINEGQPLSNVVVPVNNNPSVLKVSAAYMTTNGTPVDIANLKQGTDFVAKVTVTNPGLRGRYENMALTQIFPSGWEILNTRLYNSEGIFQSSPSDYMDIRDDRVYQYFSISAGETLTYYVQLNAAYTGTYFWPGVYAEEMYDHTVSGGVEGKWVKVE